jgi:membrane associated rhomboid family serine protease
MVARKNIFLKTVALVVILGVPALICLGLAYDTLSPREWAVGILAWVAALLLWTIVRKLAAKKTLASSAELAIALDDDTRRRILREIWLRKAWIGILAALLPFGIANGVGHRAWLPTLAGVGVSLLWVYVTAQEIRRRRERINLTRQ